jgi:hypothetical protein
VLRLFVKIYPSCMLLSKMLSCLLWHQRHGVAKLFEVVDMVTLNTSPIALVEVASSQVGIGFLGTQDMVDNNQYFMG